MNTEVCLLCTTFYSNRFLLICAVFVLLCSDTGLAYAGRASRTG